MLFVKDVIQNPNQLKAAEFWAAAPSLGWLLIGSLCTGAIGRVVRR